MPKFSNLTSLKLVGARLNEQFLKWLIDSNTRLKHLDLRRVQISQTINLNSRHFFKPNLNKWIYCNHFVEWLDISEIGIELLELGKECEELKWLYANSNLIKTARIFSPKLETIQLNNNRLRQFLINNEESNVMSYYETTINNHFQFKHLNTLFLGN